MANRKPKTPTEALEQIQRELTGNPKPQPDSPSSLPPRQIGLEPLAFQPRTFNGFVGASETHIEGLMYAIRHAPHHLIDPIDVWWSGKRWLVIDGHHRLVAYNRLARCPKKPIYVEMNVSVFEGTLEEAIRRSVAENSKNKLPMSSTDKPGAAWRLVCLEMFSISQIALDAGVSIRTVSNMRVVLKELKERIAAVLEDFTEEWSDEKIELPEEPINMTWAEARDAVNGIVRGEIDDSWKARQASEWARRLAKAFGMKPRVMPDVFAMAIREFSEDLPRLIMESGEWGGPDPDEYDEDDEDELEEKQGVKLGGELEGA